MNKHLLPIVAALVAACSGEAEPQDRTDRDMLDRGPIGKADLSGSCVDSCDKKSSGTCWCDSECQSWGDCCTDYEPACLGHTPQWSPPGTCAGAAVPGAFVDLAAALSALASSGGSICLASGVHRADAEAVVEQDLEIIGIGAGAIIQGDLELELQGGFLLLRDLQLDDLVTVKPRAPAEAEIIGCNITNGLAVDSDAYVGGKLSVDRSVIANRGGGAIVFEEERALSLHLTNSYVYASEYGIWLTTAQFAFDAKPAIVVRNNTFVRLGVGILASGTPQTAFDVDNNVFVKTVWPISLYTDADHYRASHNAYDDNEHLSTPVPLGDGDIVEPLLLDFSVMPPAPQAGSPLIDAANAQAAPLVDHHGNLRGAQPDIGAVER